jgi:hypothetical protein
MERIRKDAVTDGAIAAGVTSLHDGPHPEILEKGAVESGNEGSHS